MFREFSCTDEAVFSQQFLEQLFKVWYLPCIGAENIEKNTYCPECLSTDRKVGTRWFFPHKMVQNCSPE